MQSICLCLKYFLFFYHFLIIFKWARAGRNKVPRGTTCFYAPENAYSEPRSGTPVIDQSRGSSGSPSCHGGSLAADRQGVEQCEATKFTEIGAGSVRWVITIPLILVYFIGRFLSLRGKAHFSHVRNSYFKDAVCTRESIPVFEFA